MIKKQNKILKLSVNFLSLVKDIYKKPTANIILNNKGLNALLLRLGVRQGKAVDTFIQHCIGGCKKAIKQEKQIRNIHTGKKKQIIENYKEATKMKLDFSEVIVYKNNVEKSIEFLYTSNSNPKMKFRKQLYFQYNQ